MAVLLVLLAFNRKQLTADLDRKDARVDKIVDDYHHGNQNIVAALNSLRPVVEQLEQVVTNRAAQQ